MLPIDKGKPPRELADAKRRIKGTPDAVLNWEGLTGMRERLCCARSSTSKAVSARTARGEFRRRMPMWSTGYLGVSVLVTMTRIL